MPATPFMPVHVARSGWDTFLYAKDEREVHILPFGDDVFRLDVDGVVKPITSGTDNSFYGRKFQSHSLTSDVPFLVITADIDPLNTNKVAGAATAGKLTADPYDDGKLHGELTFDFEVDVWLFNFGAESVQFGKNSDDTTPILLFPGEAAIVSTSWLRYQGGTSGRPHSEFIWAVYLPPFCAFNTPTLPSVSRIVSKV